MTTNPEDPTPILTVRAEWPDYVKQFLVWLAVSAILVHFFRDGSAFSVWDLLIGTACGGLQCLILSRMRLTLMKDRLSYRGLFGTCSIRHDDIARIDGTKNRPDGSFLKREDEKDIRLIPKDDDAPDVRIPFELYHSQDVLRTWLADIPDTDLIRNRQKQETRERRRNTDTAAAESLSRMAEETPLFGEKPDCRRQKYLAGNLLLQTFAMLGIAVDIPLFFLEPTPLIGIWIACAMPALLLLAIALQPKRIFLFLPVDPDPPASIWFRPGALLGINSLIVLALAVVSVPSLGTAIFWVWAVPGALAILFILRRAVPDLQAPGWRVMLAFCCLVFYGYGTLSLANVFLDGAARRLAPGTATDGTQTCLVAGPGALGVVWEDERDCRTGP